MHSYGFSTGALAYGDFERALEMLAGHDVSAIELSALRDHELSRLMSKAGSLDLSAFKYVSVHAPSRFSSLSEAEASEILSPCVKFDWPIVLHPDAIKDAGAWQHFGRLLCLENMDKRKPDGRTVAELEVWFDRLPAASFCLDIGHARQVDPSLGIAFELVRRFGSRMRQIHLSELNSQSKHEPISKATVHSIAGLARRLPAVAVIIESVIETNEIDRELKMARNALEPNEDARIVNWIGDGTSSDTAFA